MDTANDFLAKGIGDSSVVALQWLNDHDFAMEVLPPGAEQTTRVLFLWVRSMTVNLDFGNYSGSPLIYGVSCQHQPTGIDVDIIFGGQPDGRISFQCDDLRIEK